MSKLTRVDYTGVLELDAEKRCALFGADGANDEVGACYAVLDSGVLINVVELAEAQGNVGACLFTGELANEMRDQAPYVHRLDQTNRFAGNVITASDAPWHLWGKGGMILMSSHASRDAVQAHWRKFTRMLDVLGKGYYFRFWEPDMLLGFLEVCSDEELEGFFGGTLITRLMLPIAKGDTLVDLRLEDASEAVAKRSFPLRPEHFHAFSAVSWMRFLLEMVAYVRAEHEGAVQHAGDDEALRARLDDLLRRAHGSYGLTKRGPQKVFVDMAMRFGDDFDSRLDWAAKVLRSPNYSGQMPRARALQNRAPVEQLVES